MTHTNRLPMPGPTVVAKQVARLVRKPKREVIVPGVYRVALWVERYLPWLVDLGARSGR
jgi:hypothetical protein